MLGWQRTRPAGSSSIEETTLVRASEGSVAVAGDNINSPITVYNHDPEEIKRLAQQLDRFEGDRRAAEAKAAELARQLDLTNVTTQTVIGFLRVLGREPELKLDQVPAKMAEITASYLQMQERLAYLSPQDSIAADFARRASAEAEKGNFEEADRLLEQAEVRELPAVDEHLRKAAQLRAARGDNAETRLQRGEAAAHYEQAAQMLPPNASAMKGLYLFNAGNLRVVSGDSASALTDFWAALAIYETLARADPGDAGWRRDLSVSNERIGDVQMAQGDLPAALTSYRASHANSESLAQADPGNAGWQRDLSVSHEQDRRRAGGAGRSAGGAESYQRRARDPRNAGAGRPRQRRMAARTVGGLARKIGDVQGRRVTWRRR